MQVDEDRPQPTRKRSKVVVQAGQALSFEEDGPSDAPKAPEGSLARALLDTLVAYRRASAHLLEGKYAGQKDAAPPHIRAPSDIFILNSTDGIFVRYDTPRSDPPKARFAQANQSVADLAPPFSEGVIHCPTDPATYVLPAGGPEMILTTVDAPGGREEVSRFRPVTYASMRLPDGFSIPPPPSRPPCIVSIQSEIDIQLQGVVAPAHEPERLSGSDVEQFIAHGCLKLPVGWHTIEIYPPLGIEHWKPEYAATWAELDLLAVVNQRNIMMSSLSSLDSRAATRQRHAKLLQEFESLLDGAEEPLHQFLRQHPELLCPTSERCWSKLAFGDRKSDFVFREPYNDYLLVEIEAPVRELFRKDGQQREELTHAINQIADWIQYIGSNKKIVEEDLGLTGISTNPRSLVVIGRSPSLTDENRRKLVTLQTQQSKLRILTYDDLLASARANLERQLGPLMFEGRKVKLYFYQNTRPNV
jgi:hypothetical protein